MATLSELESVMLPFYRKMLPLGGIVRTASKEFDNWTRDFMALVFHIQGWRQ
jgi:hypothetical protein